MKPYYDQDGITIYHGDCREVLPGLNENSIDMVFTDPPYGHNNNDGDLIHNREKALGYKGAKKSFPGRPILNDSPEDAAKIIVFLFSESPRLLKHGCCCCCCCCGGGPDPQFARWSLLMDEHLEFKQLVVWDKGGLGMGWHYRRNYECVLVGTKNGAPCKWNGGHNTSNVLRIAKIIPQEDEHPTIKPVALGAFFIRLHSDPGDLILDHFMGSGTTLVAAKQLGRRAIGIEIEEKYCEVAVRRLAQGALFGPGNQP